MSGNARKASASLRKFNHFFRSRGILVFALLVLLIISFEVAIRLSHRNRYPRGYYRVDTNAGLLSAKPNYSGYHRTEYGLVHIKNNQYGFRGQSPDRDNAETYKILILGDSFIQAAQVNYDQTLGYRLQTKLVGTCVMQVGIPGWGQGDQLRWLETYYDEFQPHMVIVAVFLGNDLPLDNMKREYLGSSGRLVTRDGILLGGKPDALISSGSRFSTNRSLAYLYLRRRLAVFVQRLAASRSKDNKLVRERNIAGNGSALPAPPHFRDNIRIYERDPIKHQKYFSTFFYLIDKFQKVCNEKRIHLIILTIPWDRTLSDTRFNEMTSRLGLIRDDYDPELAHTLIKTHMSRIGVPYVGLRDYFNQKRLPLEAYGKQNPHFSPVGHSWAAEAISTFIVEHGYLRKERSDII